MRIDVAWTMPAMATSMASTIMARNWADRAVMPAVRVSTSSQTTASETLVLLSVAVAPPDTWLAIGSMAIAPPSATPSSRRFATTELASSDVTSHITRSPSGRRTAPRRCTRLPADDVAFSRVRVWSMCWGGTTIRR